MNRSVVPCREFLLWEVLGDRFEYSEVAVTDMGHLHIYVQERIMEFAKSAPSLEELEYLGKKPVVVCAKDSGYWLLIYERGQVVALEQFKGFVN